MAYSPPRSLWRSNEAASTATANLNTTFIFLRSPEKRRRSVTLRLEPSTSTSSSSSDAGHIIGNISKKKVMLADGSFSIAEKIVSCKVTKGKGIDKENVTKKLGSGAKLVGDKKLPFWGRMLFASNKIKSIIMLNVITVVYASDIAVIKEVESLMDPAAFAAVRFIISAIPFLPFVFRARDDVQTRKAGMELGLWVSLGYLVEALGLLTSEAGRASFISLFTVIVVPLLDGMLGAIVPARTWFGVLISLVGVGVLECSGSPPNVGDLLNFLSAVFFGIHMLRTEHISRCTKKENFMALLGYQISMVAVLSTLWYVIGGWLGVQDFEQLSWKSTEMWDSIVAFPWMPALYTGIFSTALCLWVEMAAMRDVSATETAIIYGLEPVWGAAFAWFLLGERWGTMGWIGAALVMGGSLTVQIFGSLPPIGEVKNGETNEKINTLSVLDEKKQKNGLSASPVVVRSREDMIDIL